MMVFFEGFCLMCGMWIFCMENVFFFNCIICMSGVCLDLYFVQWIFQDVQIDYFVDFGGVGFIICYLLCECFDDVLMDCELYLVLMGMFGLLEGCLGKFWVFMKDGCWEMECQEFEQYQDWSEG